MFSSLFAKKPDPRQQRLDAIGAQLQAIEAEMKRIGFWAASPPDIKGAFARGEVRSYLDAPSFELWLQEIFLPNAQRGVADGKLPRQSQVGTMAMRQYDYHSSVPEAQGLLRRRSEFDASVERFGKDFP